MLKKIIEFLKRLFASQPSIKTDETVKEESLPEITIIKEEIMKYKKKDGKIIFDVSEGLPNYSQRNNEFKWAHPKNPKLTMDGLSMCNVTSMVMALHYIGFKFPNGKFTQPEDNLCEFIFTSKEVDDYYKKVMPAMWEQFNKGDTNAYCPNLIHAVLAYATNLWMGTSCVTFKDAALITDIIKEIVEFNRPVVMSGTFPYKYANGNMGTIGHINVLVGCIFNENDENFINQPSVKPETFIVDDPYGNWKQNFAANSSGNDTLFSYAEFIKYYKTLNDTQRKFAHIFKNAAALI